MTKSDSLKLLAKRETVVLKVFIHCHQCQKQVKKVLRKLDGIESITIDAELGKLTVVGMVPASILVKKLGKAGKYAALWGSIPSSFPTPSRDYKKDQFTAKTANYLPDYDGINSMAKLGGENFPRISSFGNMNDQSNNYLNYMLGSDLNELNNTTNNGNNNNNNNKKLKGGKRVSFTGGPAGGGGGPLMYSHHVNSNDSFLNNVNAMVANRSMSVTGYGSNVESVEFATHMFSDENANNCSIM